MTVRAGREFLAIPGPTTMPDEVLRAMHRPALDIYSDQMIGMTDSLLADLSKLFATKGHSYIYIANGHGAWEAVLKQCAVARRQGAGAGKRPVRDRLGQCRGRDGRRRRSAEGRLAPRHPPRRGRGPSAAGQGRTRSRRSSRCRSIPPRAPTTTSKPSARRSRRQAIRHCSWSTPSPRSAACRFRWTRGASTSRCPARRRA